MAFRTLTTAAAAVTVALGALAVPASAAAPRKPALPGDFNGDGRRDVATGAPNAAVGGLRGAGLIAVAYGSAKGANPKQHQVLTAAGPGLPGSPEDDAGFGQRPSSADFDKDGYADLVVSQGNGNGTGIVYGGPKGLTGRTATLPGTTYGDGGTVGDFDGNGTADVIVRQGDALLVYRNPGAKPGTPQTIALVPENGEFVRTKAVAADFNGDHRTDLVLLANDDIDGEPQAPRIELRLGTASGLGARQVVARRMVDGGAAGDVNGDGRADLVYARDGDDASGARSIGIRYGTAKGLGPEHVVTQAAKGVPGSHAAGDGWGRSLAVGDTDHDGRADIAIGAPTAPVGKVEQAGTVTVLRGAKGGWTATGAKLISQATAGVAGAAEKGDLFGYDVAFTDADGDGRADLAVGNRGENKAEGRIYVFPGAKAGLTVKGLVQFGPDSLGIGGRQAELGAYLLH
ncbi:FG-GAP and VCBS repeat-containing protein [Actinomadura parmotrematis]|uniref:FG-GAP-like repeat-containing protein n=1 Tax=Actinomadura parmotrematis TaxID=2864039 RepID=A0ABS7FL95_9ACTN|nr:FG-GAP and VCBS repeat-containing protein [Actinomadura parmotrematis]MBW8480795.1 FG-GAP-like repeat-containing protein [Actinomadura parmotrematis]